MVRRTDRRNVTEILLKTVLTTIQSTLLGRLLRNAHLPSAL